MTITGNRGRENTREKMITDYSRKRLLTYADSFRELAECLVGECPMDREGQRRGGLQQSGMQQEGLSEDRTQQADRQQLFDSYSQWERQQVLCRHMNEMSKILSRVASEVFYFSPFPDRLRRRVIQALRIEKIIVTDIYYVRGTPEREQREEFSFGVSMYSGRMGGYTVQDVADMLSVLLDRRIAPSVTAPYKIDKEEKTFVFVEEPHFLVVPGYAKAVKESETISGDNYAIIESVKGGLHVFLADGMGSGEKAGKDSEQVLELMEKLMEAGYDIDTAMNLVNNALSVSSSQNLSTLDVCSLDLYSGMCQFRKAGAATTFLKSNTYVEQISISSLPLGVFQDRENEVVTRELIENDYIIMVTDGIIDALESGGYENMLQSYMEGLQERNPGEIARRILQFVLHCSGGKVADDMTVVVLGVYQCK